jgi:hypothetical protein
MKIRTIGNQAAGIGEFPKAVNCGKLYLDCKIGDQQMLAIEIECVSMLQYGSQATGKQSMLPQQTSGYQECANAGMAGTRTATINKASGISGTR